MPAVTRSIAALVAILLAFPDLVGAQAPRHVLSGVHHTTWGAAQGVPSSMGWLMRSSDGYLWMAASGRLVRFDGARFTSIDSTTTAVLASAVPGEFKPLLVDSRGVLWIARPDGGLVSYRDAEFKLVLPPTRDRGRIMALTEDARGRVWAIARGVFVLHNGALVTAPLPPGFPTDVSGIIRDNANGVWIGTFAHGLWHVSPDGARQESQPVHPTDRVVRPLVQGADGALWVAGRGLHVLRDGLWSAVLTPGRSNVVIPAVAEVSGDDVWIGSRGAGLLRIRAGRIEQFSRDDGLSNAVVQGISIDGEGSVWVTTDAGLDRLRRASVTTIGRRQGLPFDSAQMIRGDVDGAVWAQPQGGGRLFRMDGKLINGVGDGLGSTVFNAAAGRGIYPMAAARRGGVWMTDSLRVIHTSIEGLVPLAARIGLPPTRPQDLVEDRRGTLWIGFQPEGFGRVRNGQYQAVSLPGVVGPTKVGGIVEDSKGTIWVALAGLAALFEISPNDSIRVHDSTVAYPLTDMTIGPDDIIWATTPDGGLMRIIDGRAAVLRLPAIATVLRGVSGTLVATADHLWFASEDGIGRLTASELEAVATGRLDTAEPRWFTEADGAVAPKISAMNPASGFRGRDGRIWFSTPAGLAVIDPAALIDNPVLPQVHIEEIIVGGRRVTGGPVLKIAPNPDRVEIHYTATSLLVPERVRLEYQMQGVDSRWRQSGPDRSASYTQLRPGRYTFRVRAWNEDGRPSARDATLALSVLPAWYQTWWFSLTLVLAVAGISATGALSVVRARQRRDEDRLRTGFEATLAERTRIARELHDTLLQGFTGITLMLEAVRHSLQKAPDEAARVLGNVLTLADDTLREARQMVWDIRPVAGDAVPLHAAIGAAAQRAVEPADGVAVSVAVAGAARPLRPVVELTALRIVNEAVLNAVRHGRPSAIDIDIEYGADILRISVCDNGSGFDHSVPAPDGHFGIVGMRERAKLANGSLTVSSVVGSGTRVTCEVPTGPSASHPG